MKRQKSILVPKQLTTLDKKRSLRFVFSHSTTYLVHYYIFYKMLKIFTQKYYKYGLSLIKYIRKLLAFETLKNSLLLYPSFYLFFPYHKVTKQLFLREVDFYKFFTEKPTYSGFLISNKFFFDNRFMSKTSYSSFRMGLHSGINYYINIKSFSSQDYLNSKNILLQKELYKENPAIIFKGVYANHITKLRFFYISLTFYDILFYLFLIQLKELYRIYILLFLK